MEDFIVNEKMISDKMMKNVSKPRIPCQFSMQFNCEQLHINQLKKGNSK